MENYYIQLESSLSAFIIIRDSIIFSIINYNIFIHLILIIIKYYEKYKTYNNT